MFFFKTFELGARSFPVFIFKRIICEIFENIYIYILDKLYIELELISL